MENSVYFSGVRIDGTRPLYRVWLYDAGGCMAARACDSSECRSLYHDASVLRAYMVLEAWNRKDQKLLESARKPLLYEKPEDLTGAVPFDVFTEIPEKIPEDAVAVYWIAEALTGAQERVRYLSLFYALQALAGPGNDLCEFLGPYSRQEQLERFLRLIACLKEDQESADEQGKEYQAPVFDQPLFEEFLMLWKTIRESKTEKNGKI